MNSAAHLEIGPKVFGNEGRVALREHHDLLLYVLDLVLGLLEVDDLDGDHVLRPVVDPLVDLAERAFADSLLLRKHQLGVDALKEEEEEETGLNLAREKNIKVLILNNAQSHL